MKNNKLMFTVIVLQALLIGLIVGVSFMSIYNNRSSEPSLTVTSRIIEDPTIDEARAAAPEKAPEEAAEITLPAPVFRTVDLRDKALNYGEDEEIYRFEVEAINDSIFKYATVALDTRDVELSDLKLNFINIEGEPEVVETEIESTLDYRDDAFASMTGDVKFVLAEEQIMDAGKRVEYFVTANARHLNTWQEDYVVSRFSFDNDKYALPLFVSDFLNY